MQFIDQTNLWGVYYLSSSTDLSIHDLLVGLPPHAKICLIGKDSDAERDWGREEKGTTEDEMAGWHH